MNVFIDAKLNTIPGIIDEKVMLELKKFMGEEGDELEQELIGMYLSKTPTLLSAITADLNNGDLTALKVHVHTLKGSSAQLGIIGVSNLCKHIEELISGGAFTEIPDQIKQLETLFRQVKKYYSK